MPVLVHWLLLTNVPLVWSVDSGEDGVFGGGVRRYTGKSGPSILQ